MPGEGDEDINGAVGPLDVDLCTTQERLHDRLNPSGGMAAAPEAPVLCQQIEGCEATLKMVEKDANEWKIVCCDMGEPGGVGWTARNSGRPVAEAMDVPRLETAPAAPEEPCAQFRSADTVGLPVEDMDIESTDNDLDMAIKNAKVAVRHVRHGVSDKGGMNRRKRSHRRKKKVDSVSRFITQTAKKLEESKVFLVASAVNKLGVQAVRDLVKEVEVIQRDGGQMTADGKRKRTAGGVLWNLMKSRLQADVYKDIMNEGKEFEKKRSKEKVKRQRMEIEVQRELKRRKIGSSDSYSTFALAHFKETGEISGPVGSFHSSKKDSIQGDPDDVHISSQAQLAWEKGLAWGRSSYVSGNAEITHCVMSRKPASLAERIRVPVGYDDLPE